MLDCCEKLYLGEYAHNEDKVFSDLVAEETGDYTFELKFGGVIRKYTLPFTVGDPLTIPVSKILNEDAMYLMNIKDPNGDYISFNYFQCFTFKTVISLSDCDNCNPYIYGLDFESSIDDNPDFELGIFE